MNKSISLAPDNIYLREALASVYVLQQRNDKAEEVLRNCIQIDPKNITFYLRLNQLFMRTG